MFLVSPLLLLALAALPLLWWLLRASPPPPRIQSFPAIRLLAGLHAQEETPLRTPPWLLALRLLAAALLIVAAAGPVVGRHKPGGAAGAGGDVLLAIDNGWAAAHDWSRRLAAADAILGDAGREKRLVALLPTAPDEDASPPALTPFLPAEVARTRLAALRPHPWGTDRAAAARALAALPAHAAETFLLADGVRGVADAAFAAALRRAAAGPIAELRDDELPARLLLPPVNDADGMTIRLARAGAAARRATALALDERGGVLARVALVPGPGGIARGRVALPLEVRNTLARIVVPGLPSAATTRLLDESDRRRPVGLLAGEAGSETPLTGALFFLERALAGDGDIRQGTLDALLARPLSVLVMTDRTVTDPATAATLLHWVEHGGTLIRFAGPRLAAAADGADRLLPVALMPGSRALGGAMSWARPQHLAPFPPGSPFGGLSVPDEVTVSRQVLARPDIDLGRRSWVVLADGTPLVTARTIAHGRIVLFHVTANADWSNLPLSGLFVQMLDRLVHLASGIAAPGDRTMLAPVSTLDANGVLGPPGPAASGVPADAFGTTPASPRHPPGIYGRSGERRSLNVADAAPPLAASEPIGRIESLERHVTDLPLGPPLLAAALLLLAADLVLSLLVRGLLGRATVRGGLGAALLLGCALAARPGAAHAVEASGGTAVPRAALQTELAYVVTGNAEVDRLSEQGLASLSDYVNARTAATLGAPAGVRPGVDDLAFYPLLYWPILPDAPLDRHAIAALDTFMRNGGIVLIDTEGGDAGDAGGGSGAGFAPGAGAALRRMAAGLDVPPLAPLTPAHVLAHSFYLLHDFPGRFVGAPVWVARGEDLANDGVSPVIIGANAWAAAWAVGPDGQPAVSVIPGGESQRTMAYRFGVNLVMYALTGNYKADQVHVPALLQRLGRDDAAGGDDAGGADDRGAGDDPGAPSGGPRP